MTDKLYLADAQVGDKLYSFLEGNREYSVILREGNRITVRPIGALTGADDVELFLDGTAFSSFIIPHFLYAPVNVLDPKNLPPRPWKPKKGEWVWCRHDGWKAWDLRQFMYEEDGWCFVKSCDGKPTKALYFEIAPFKGELPPGLEEENE